MVRYRAVPCMYSKVEDGGRLGAHALALFRALAVVAIEKGRRPPFAYKAANIVAATLVSLWVQRWQQRMSSWLHMAISKHVIRHLLRALDTFRGS